ncbi:MAG: hypothetical protein IPG90_21225 [Bacteroidetes bacterium]|nr:hypothetical protein [Bacteroidota bacterium]
MQYNLWANQRLLDIISEHCSDEQLNRELVSSFPTIRKTLLHIWGAESVWLIRLNGSSPNAWTWMQYEGSQDELKKKSSTMTRHGLTLFRIKMKSFCPLFLITKH